MTIDELIPSVDWVFGLLLDAPSIAAQAVNAARQYAAWGDIASVAASATITPPAIAVTTELTEGEWGAIKPLFMLYVERENARGLEASRNQGVEVYGRMLSEIEQDILRYETEILPRVAFSCFPESI